MPESNSLACENLDSLRDMFPGVHEHIIVKADVLRNGVAPTDDLHEIGRWAKTDSDNVFDYHRVPVDERAPVDGGRWLHPESLALEDETVIKLMLDADSPYTVKAGGDGHRLCYLGEPLLDVHFLPKPEWYDMRTAGGRLMSAVGYLRGHCSFSTIITNHCEFFDHGRQCRYCNMDVNTRRMADMGRDVIEHTDPADMEETVRSAYRECGGKIAHWGGSGGSRWNRDEECDHYVSIIGAIREGLDRPGWTTLCGEWDMQAMDDEQHARLWDTNFEAIGHNLEVYGEAEFARTCPGKHENVGYDGWLESLLRAAGEYWGQGKVMSSFVGGIELAEQNGHTLESGLEHTLAGWEHLMSEGVVPRFGLWQANPGSPWVKDPNCPPPTSYYLQLGVGHNELMNTYGLRPNPTGTCYRDLDRNIYEDFYHLM